MAETDIIKGIEQIVYSYATALKKKYIIHSVYLYGSFVKGTMNKDNDIDVALIAENFLGDPVDDIADLMKFRRGIDLRIEPRPFSISDFNHNNPLAHEVIQNGIRIM
jgi:predicted nucleotidyltransferase